MNTMYFIKKSRLNKIVDMISLILGIVAIICLFLNFRLMFEIISVLAIVMFIIFNYKIFSKENRMKTFIKTPIIFDKDNNMFILIKNTSYILFLAIFFIIMSSGLFILILGLHIHINDIEFAIYILDIMLITMYVREFKNKYDILKVKNNLDNINNLVTSKNILNINNLKKLDNNTYLINYNNEAREVVFSDKYENYQELIDKISKKCL